MFSLFPSAYLFFLLHFYHKWSLTICDGYFDTLKSQKCEVRQVTKDVDKSEV